MEDNSRGSSSIEKSDELTKADWMERIGNMHMQRADMNRLIMNYLVTEGFKGAAEKFRIESGIQPAVELDTLDERIKIRDAIQSGRIEEAIQLVNNLHPELLDSDRYLYFHLQQLHLIELIRQQKPEEALKIAEKSLTREHVTSSISTEFAESQQQLIELIRQRKIEEALKYAQEQLAERGEENKDVLYELERTLALLAFDKPEQSPFGDLLHPSHRQKIASEVNASILEMENRESTTPKLAILLKLMLWSQEELEKKKIKYPKMTDIAHGIIEDPK